MSRVVFLDDKSLLDKELKESLNKILMVEYRLFQIASTPIVKEEEGNENEIKVLSSSVRSFISRSYGKWHCCSFLLRNPKKNELLINIGETIFFTFSALDSYADAVESYSGIECDEEGRIRSTYSSIGTWLVSCYWREYDSNDFD